VVKLLNLENLGDDRLLRHNADCINDICFAPKGNFVVTAGDHGIVQVWDCVSGNSMHRLYGLEAHISSVATDGATIAASDVNGNIQVWSPITGKQLSRLEGHDKSVNTVVFTPDGSMLATAGNDGTIRFWNRALWSSSTTTTTIR
jgi:WD40 repeat protein